MCNKASLSTINLTTKKSKERHIPSDTVTRWSNKVPRLASFSSTPAFSCSSRAPLVLQRALHVPLHEPADDTRVLLRRVPRDLKQWPERTGAKPGCQGGEADANAEGKRLVSVLGREAGWGTWTGNSEVGLEGGEDRMTSNLAQRQSSHRCHPLSAPLIEVVAPTGTKTPRPRHTQTPDHGNSSDLTKRWNHGDEEVTLELTILASIPRQEPNRIKARRREAPIVRIQMEMERGIGDRRAGGQATPRPL